MIIIVDLCLGPLATFLVSSPQKPPHLLRMNIAVIITIQIAALAYGTWVLWQGRPLFYVLTIDRIELVTASDFKEAGSTPDYSSDRSCTSFPNQVQWVWAPLPENPEERDKIILSATLDGKDITVMPQYFHDWGSAIKQLNQQLHPLSKITPQLRANNPKTKNLGKINYDKFTPMKEYGWLKIEAIQRSGIMIFNRKTGCSLQFISITDPPKPD